MSNGDLLGLLRGVRPPVVPKEIQQKRDFQDMIMRTSLGSPTSTPVTQKEIPIESSLASKLKGFGIEDLEEQAGILAQLKAESEFKPRSESLRYSPERLLQVFPKYFRNLNDAKEVVKRGERGIGDRIYGGRMGNASDEGYKYRGRGLIQLTGKNNYQKYGEKIGKDLVGNPDLANDPDVALQIAVEYMKDRSKNLRDATENTRAVGPVQWKKKALERKVLQDEILKLLQGE